MNQIEERGTVFVEEILEHHGVKGQKWGVRKRRTSSEDASRHGSAKKKKLKELSDSELKALVNRMNMEQQARRLNPNKVAKGHNAAKTIVGVMGTVTAVAAFANSGPGKAIGRGLARGATRAIKIPVGSIGKID